MAASPAICPLCEASCGLLVETDAGRVRAVRGDPEDPFSRGYCCPKAAALVDLHDDPDRLRAPLVRDGTRWRETTWSDALDRAAEGLRRIRRAHGRDAVAVYYGNPVAHNLGLMTHGLSLARALRSRNTYSASSADQLPQMLTALRMFGHLALIPVPDLDRTDLLLILGANPAVSNGSLMTAPGMPGRLRAIRARGGRVVVVDPRRTETADLADEHLPVRPGSDALLLAAMLHVIFSDGLARLGSFGGCVTHLDALTALVEELPPERVARRTGIAPETIRQLARSFARTPRAACYGRVGMCTQQHGTLATWLAQVLNLVTGHVDERGGMMFTTPAVDVVGLMSRMRLDGTYDRWRTRVRRLPEFSGDAPVAALADEIETEGTGRIRALVTMAGNPVLSAPNGARLDRALGTLEHVVSIDPYLNETTRHAHVILPPAPPLARAHYGLAVNAFAVRNVAKYAAPVVPLRAEERHDWEIVAELAGRLFLPHPLRPAGARLLRACRPERLLDALLRMGPYGLSLARLRRTPHGMDLGPLEAGRLRARIRTPGHLVDLAPPDFVREARTVLPREADAAATGDLVLIGRRQARSNNSWMHNAPRLVKGRQRCTLLIHPDDAAPRGLASGDVAELAAGSAAIAVTVEVDAGMRPGVVSLPHGWGHDRDGARLRTAAAHAGASINDVTNEHHLDTLSGNAAFNGLVVAVRLKPDAGAAPQ